MKLAQIPNKDIVTYATKHNYFIKQYACHNTLPTVVEMFNACIQQAEKDKCIEFIFHEFKDKFMIMEDRHTWTISVIAFGLKN